jgi:hypothetical protein
MDKYDIGGGLIQGLQSGINAYISADDKRSSREERAKSAKSKQLYQDAIAKRKYGINHEVDPTTGEESYSDDPAFKAAQARKDFIKLRTQGLTPLTQGEVEDPETHEKKAGLIPITDPDTQEIIDTAIDKKGLQQKLSADSLRRGQVEMQALDKGYLPSFNEDTGEFSFQESAIKGDERANKEWDQLEKERKAKQDVIDREYARNKRDKLDPLELEAKRLANKKAQKELDKKSVPSRGKIMPSSAALQTGGANASILALENAEKAVRANKDITGPIQGRLSGLLSLGELGERGKRFKGLATQLRINAQVIGKYLEGGKVTDQDIDRYLLMLPNGRDSSEIVTKKTDILKELIRSKQEQDTMSLHGAGYDTSGMERLITPSKKAGLVKNKPNLGHVQDGYRYIGGDPGNPKSWDKVKK